MDFELGAILQRRRTVSIHLSLKPVSPLISLSVASSQEAYVVYTFQVSTHTVQIDDGNSVTLNGTKSQPNRPLHRIETKVLFPETHSKHLEFPVYRTDS